MSVALYRKYRPKSFAEVTGQNHIKITLQNEIESGRVVHAYLFCGPRGTGKTTMARLLAKAVNCLDIQASGESCNRCSSCVDIMENKALDIIEIDAASHTGVDNVRENIIQNARFTPAKSKFKIFIIDEVHMLSISAFNALLKVLEEAPARVIFILATTEAHKVPSTIISRCQRFDFKKINLNELVSRLKWIVGQENIQVEDKVLSLVAKQSGGCVRDAESLLEQILSLGDKNITSEQAEIILPRADFDLLFRLFEFIYKKQTAAAISFISRLIQDGIDINLFADNFVEFARQILIYKISGNLDELSREIEDAAVQEILKLSPSLSDKFLVEIIKEFLICREIFKQSYVPQLAIEMAIIRLTGGQGGAAPTSIKSGAGKYFTTQEKGGQDESKQEKSEQEKDGQKKDEQEKSKMAYFSASPAIEFSVAEISKIAEAKKSSDVVAAGLHEATVSATDENNPASVVIEKNGEDHIDGDLTAHWENILNQVREKNYSLYMSLRMGCPASFDGARLAIGFIFELQRQRVEKIENKRLISEILENVFGRKVEFATYVDSSLKIEDLYSGNNRGALTSSAADSIDQLANEFGGTVIDS